MVSPVKMALADVHAVINEDLLRLAFNPSGDYRVSIDQAIIDKVILARVRDAISIRGGRTLDIVLNQNWSHYTISPTPYAIGVTGTYSAFTVPPEARENRDIVAITGIRLLTAIGTGIQNSVFNSLSAGGHNLQSLAIKAIQSQTGSNLVALPNPMLHDGNMIVFDPPQTTFLPWVVSVRLSYDDNFSNMPPAIIPAFSKVVVLAVKTYIHTNLELLVESNAVIRGVELGVIKSKVESFAEAAEKYEEELVNLGGAEVFDPARTSRILQKVLGT